MILRTITAVVGIVALAACTETTSPLEVDVEMQAELVAADFATSLALIDGVASTLAATEIGGRFPDRTRAALERKLTDAASKLTGNRLKPADAIQKLMDFRSAVISLRDKTKPELAAEDANALIAGAEAAILDIAGIAGSEPPSFA